MQHKINRGALPPLFERIIDPKLGMVVPLPLLDATALRESIIRELSLILNTRCTVRNVLYEAHFETISLFGMPDFFGLGDLSEFDGSNSDTWLSIARHLEISIQAAEPRLDNIRVAVEAYDRTNQVLDIVVHASVKNSPLLQEIHFPLALSHTPSQPSS